MKSVVIAALILVMWTSTHAQSVPPVVSKAFQQTYPGATITSTVSVQDDGRPAYRVEGVDKGRKRRVLYDLHGAVIEAGEQVTEKELPKAVADAMYSHPRAIFVSAMKVTRRGAVQYRLSLRGTRKTALVTNADGSVLSFK